MPPVHKRNGLRYNTSEAMTLEQVAQVLGVTAQEVARIERQALRKLRAMPEAKNLTLLLARFEMAIQPEEW